MKINLLFFVFGLLLGFFLSCLLFQSFGSNGKSLVQLPSPKGLEKTVVKAEVQYTKKYDSLKAQSKKLRVELQTSKTALEKEKQKTYSLRVQVFDLLDKRFEEQNEINYQKDTLSDSLAEMVPNLITSSVKKDSLYEQVVINLEEQLQNKDSTLSTREQQYGEIKSAFTKSIEGQNELAAQNKSLSRQVKRQKLKSRILSAVLFVFTGAAASYLLHP